MANRQRGFGLTAELNRQAESKWDAGLAEEAWEWICHYVPDAGDISEFTSAKIHEKLKDGQILCKLMNGIQADSIKKINTDNMVFKQMENIGNFLGACEKYGVDKTDMFHTVDLREAQNMPNVINGIHALGRKALANGKKGLGAKESQENNRAFTEEQLGAGAAVIGLQMGSNQGASQAGRFGKTRAIVD